MLPGSAPEPAIDLVFAFLAIAGAINPVGKASLFIASLASVAPERRRAIVLRRLLTALPIMLVFLVAAHLLVTASSVAPTPFVLLGGAALCATGARRIFLGRERTLLVPASEHGWLVPLAFPYVAGPSVLAVELGLVARDPDRWAVWLLAAYLAWLASAFLLYGSVRVRRILGDRGIRLIEAAQGLVLLGLGAELILYAAVGTEGLFRLGA